MMLTCILLVNIVIIMLMDLASHIPPCRSSPAAPSWRSGSWQCRSSPTSGWLLGGRGCRALEEPLADYMHSYICIYICIEICICICVYVYWPSPDGIFLKPGARNAGLLGSGLDINRLRPEWTLVLGLIGARFIPPVGQSLLTSSLSRLVYRLPRGCRQSGGRDFAERLQLQCCDYGLWAGAAVATLNGFAVANGTCKDPPKCRKLQCRHQFM